jgi:spore photoproduct lyase
VIDLIYVEEGLERHPRAQAIGRRFPGATWVPCARYTEVFNPKAQNFRLQKRRPALILARKHEGLVLEAPAGYGLGGSENYYFSHMLNCLYDCRYCFLQGRYRSAHYVLFVNFETFEQAMDDALVRAGGRELWFFSGYDCDSLALEPVSGFAAHFLAFFASRAQARLELRTKSTQVRVLLEREPLDNVVVAFSFTPEPVSRALEHRVPPVAKRIAAMARLQRSGWRVGVRLDPLIYTPDYRDAYQRLLADVFGALDLEALHSVSLGGFRLPRPYYKTIQRLYPEEPLFAGPLALCEGMVSYVSELEQELSRFCTRELLRYIPQERLFPCSEAA